MKIQDLGALIGDVMLFGGPYSNEQATWAALNAAAARGIAATNVICTGDVVAYCASPARTVALVRDAGITVVAGNCERQLAAGAMDCGCGFEDGTACDLLSAGWYAHVDKEIGVKDRDWMAGLPDVVVFTHCGRRVAVIHGGVTYIARFIWSVSAETVFSEEVAALQAQVGKVDMVVAGHSGVAFARDVAGVRWINAGVIGMPAHDGTRDTRFAVLSERGVAILPLVYDAEAAFADMEQVGLRQGYDQALVTGFWPSEDVLPPELRLPDFANG
ncbi:Calcineurin-like phosphoesterase superfamily domain protein [Shimia sp. SK013]|uniref:metallophosphoesterase family protein n=1 Tax=Shimia sp. SK013 TaxID=1389006 RepID=UPI0006B54774|nr:metallophosphoesterase family protein [Shimia sp. SK013]KPA22746.1 Calcineurin-like phosphoesterase superfamily domain protein [Shimia sp. SK013]